MEASKILVIGGYGAVGKNITGALVKIFPGEVIIAGPNLKKAENLSDRLGRKCIPMEFDIALAQEDDHRIDGVKLIIMCIDQKDTRFVFQCIKKGINYIDITANYEYLSKIEHLNNAAEKFNSIVVLSVGIAPGLSNLLARHCKIQVPDIQYVDIFILLGLGEKHGDAAFRWSFNDLNDQFYINDGDKKQFVKSFEDGKRTVFPGGLGKRKTYRSNFSDQHVIPKTSDLCGTSTRICLDSPFMTWIYAMLKKTGLSKIFKIKIVQDFFIKLLQAFTFGTDIVAVKVEGKDKKDGDIKYECSLHGNGEAKITGLVAAKVAENLCTGTFPAGVFHIEQLFKPVEFIESLESSTLIFEDFDKRL